MYSEEDDKHLIHVYQKDAWDARTEAEKYRRKFEHCRSECKKWKNKYLEAKKKLDISTIDEENNMDEYEPACPLGYDVCVDGPGCKGCKYSRYDDEDEYEPTCPLGYDDCVRDPAYIKHFHPDWYEKLYGNKSPEEVAKEKCNTPFGCYDDEDK